MVLPDCYFYHIPKTAGMTSWQMLEWLYPEEKICPGRMWEDIINVPLPVLQTFEAFRGHFLAYLEPYLDRKLTTFTILRNPVERTISHFCHVQRSAEHPFYDEARTLTLAEFCTHPRTRHMVQDYQSRYLACLGQKCPRELARTMTNHDFAGYKLQLALDPLPDEFPPGPELYRAAHNRLRSFVAVGITERLRESFRLIARKLGAPNPPEFDRRNIAPNRITGVDNRTMQIIFRCTEVDHALYADELKGFEHTVAELFDRDAHDRNFEWRARANP